MRPLAEHRMMSRAARGSAVILSAVCLLSCNGEKKTGTDTTAASSSDPGVTSGAQTGAAVVSGARIPFPHAGPPGEWQMPAGDYSNSRYSELASITPQNAAKLRVAWAFSTGVLRGH